MFYIVLGFMAGTVAAWTITWSVLRSRSSVLGERLSSVQGSLAVCQSRLGESANKLELSSAESTRLGRELATTVAERDAARNLVAEKDKNLGLALEERALLTEEVKLLNIDKSSLSTAIHAQNERHEDQLKLWNDAEQRFKETFDSLASRALQGNNQQFLALAKSEMERQQQQAQGDLDSRKTEVENLVKPISDTLDRLGKEVREIENKREGAYSEIKTQIEGLRISGDQIKSEASRLVNALRMPQQRGRWGEIQLRRVVELAGMVRHCDFDEQVTTRDDENRAFRPDMTVRLPGGRTIVVDSKVALNAYLEAAACDDENQRNAKLKEHALQVREHLKSLSRQSYWNQFENTPEFVVAFLPGEAFFSAALLQDPTLIEFGAEQRVVLATPTTLIALLKAVSYGWRQEDIAANAQQISELGKQLYERLATMHGHIAELRRGLDASVRSFNKMAGAMESRVMVSARRFRELGATVADEVAEVEPIENTPRELISRTPTVIRALAASTADE